MKRHILLVALASLLLVQGLAVASHAQLIPGLRFKGILTEISTGMPKEGLVDVVLRVYAQASGGTALYEEAFSTMLVGGSLDVILGAGFGNATGNLITALSPDPMTGNVQRYIAFQVTPDTVEASPRRLITGGGYSIVAMHAADTARLGGQPASSYVTTTAAQAFATQQQLSQYVQLNPPPNQTQSLGGTITYAPGASVTFAQPTGQPPFMVSSTTLIENLNCAQLGGVQINQIARLDTVNVFEAANQFSGATTFESNATFQGNTQFQSAPSFTIAQGMAPFIVTSSTQVNNLNAAFLNGLSSAQIIAMSGGGGGGCTSCSNATQLGGQDASFYQNATNLTAGTVPDARLGTNICRNDAAQTISASHVYQANTLLVSSGSANTTINSAATSATTITLPNASGTVITTGNLGAISATGTVTSGTWQGGVIGGSFGGTGLDVASLPDGAILRKTSAGWQGLAPGSTGKVLKIDGAGLPDWSDDNVAMGTGGGTVTSVGSGDGLTGGTITTSGTLSVDATVARKSINNAFTTQQSIQSGAIGNVGLMVNGPSGQTANLQNWQVNGGTLASISATGGLTASTLAGSGSSITNLNASNLASGTVDDARLSSNIPRLNGNHTFTGQVTMNNASNAFTGSGAGLTGLNAAAISTGVLSDAVLSTNIPRLNGNHTFTGQLTMNNASNAFTGTFSGNGAAITGLNAAAISAGVLSDAVLSTNIPRLDGNPTFTGAVTMNNGSNAFTGSGANLTNLNASNLSSGTVPSDRLGALNADNLTSGTVPSARISGTYSSAVTFNNATNSFTGASASLGSATLTGALGLGSSVSVPMGGTAIGGAGAFSGGTFNSIVSASLTGGLTLGSTLAVPAAGTTLSGGQFKGTLKAEFFQGDGSGLTNLPSGTSGNAFAGDLPEGCIADARDPNNMEIVCGGFVCANNNTGFELPDTCAELASRSPECVKYCVDDNTGTTSNAVVAFKPKLEQEGALSGRATGLLACIQSMTNTVSLVMELCKRDDCFFPAVIMDTTLAQFVAVEGASKFAMLPHNPLQGVAVVTPAQFGEDRVKLTATMGAGRTQGAGLCFFVNDVVGAVRPKQIQMVFTRTTAFGTW